MDDYDKVIIFTGLISYFAAIVQGVATFGDAIMIHLMWRVAVLWAPDVMASTPFGEDHLLGVVLILTIRALFVQYAFCARSTAFMCPSLLKATVPVHLFMILTGAVVLARFHRSEWLTIVIGLFFAATSAQFLWVNSRQLVRNRMAGIVVHRSHHDFVATKKMQWYLGIASFVGGLLSGIVGIGGPPLMIASVMLDLPQPILRGTFPFTFAAAYTVRVSMGIVMGWHHLAEWKLYAAAVLGAIAGLQVGIELSGRIAHDMFVFLVCWLMLFASVVLMQLPASILMLTFAVCIASFIAMRFVKTTTTDRVPTAPTTPLGGPVLPSDFVSRGEAPQLEMVDDLELKRVTAVATLHERYSADCTLGIVRASREIRSRFLTTVVGPSFHSNSWRLPSSTSTMPSSPPREPRVSPALTGCLPSRPWRPCPLFVPPARRP